MPIRNKDRIVAWSVIDVADWELVGSSNWFLSVGYANRSTPGKWGTQQAMHRVILGLEKGDSRVGDHINFNRLDNRRSNLRIVTMQENQAWRPGIVEPSSRLHPGVRWDASRGAWVASRTIEIGEFGSEAEAVAAALTS